MFALIQVVVLWYFYDATFVGPDEGFYATIARRLTEGQRLGLEIHQHQGGLLHYVNALSLWVLGQDFLSLRLPLTLGILVEGALVFHLLRHWGLATQLVGSTALLGMGWVHFISPTANWTSQLMAVALAWLLAELEPGKRKWVLAGVLISTAFLIRQSNALLLGPAAWGFLLLEQHRERGWSGSGALGAALAALPLGLYMLLVHQDLFSWLFLSLWAPLLLLRVAHGRVEGLPRILGWLSLGLALPLAAMGLFQLLAGDPGGYFHDVFVRGSGQPTMEHFLKTSYTKILLVAKIQLTAPQLWGKFKALYWFLLLLPPVALGALTNRAVWQQQESPRRLALAWVSVFLVPACLLSHTLIYLHLILGLAAAALLTVAPYQIPTLVLVGAMTLAGLVGHGGQPLDRGAARVFNLQRVPLLRNHGLPHNSLAISPEQQRHYSDLLAVIEEKVPQGNPFLVLPNAPELEFMSGRPNPFPFVRPMVGWEAADDGALVRRTIGEKSLPLILYDADDLHVTQRMRSELIPWLEQHYQNTGTVSGILIYEPRPESP